jgi:hypothetical protein
MRKPIHSVAGLAGLLLLAAPAAAQDAPAAPAAPAPLPAPAAPPAPIPPAPTPPAALVVQPAPAAPSAPVTPASPTTPTALQIVQAFAAQSPPELPSGNVVKGPIFPEEVAPPSDPQNPNSMRFALHGYFRAPLRIGWRARTDAKPGEASTSFRTPWLVDDDFFQSGFKYTRNAESDFTELYLMAGNEHLTGTVSLQGSLYSDPAQPLIDKQMGISQGFLTYRYNFDLPADIKLRLKVKGGAFSDRFGWQEHYDTYIFGRTHQMGEQVRADLDVGKLTFSVLEGFGAHLEQIQSNQGLSMLDYFRLSASYDKTAELALYYLRTWTQDKRQLKEIADASMRVMGVEARVDSGPFGRLVVGLSGLSADQATSLAPSLEVMHSSGGRGITENYLGTDKSNNGTGSLFNLGFQYDFSMAGFLKKLVAEGKPLGDADVTYSVFGMYTRVGSDQKDPDPTVNRDGDQMFKWGMELNAWPLSWLGASVRYDRVIPDIHDDPSAFRIISPRLTLRTHWIADAMLYVQWSHYIYGERVALRQGQIPLEVVPDNNMLKIQAQLAF